MNWKYRPSQYGSGSERLQIGRLLGSVYYSELEPKGSKEKYIFGLSFKQETWKFETEKEAKEFGEQMMEVVVAGIYAKWLKQKGEAPQKRKK